MPKKVDTPLIGILEKLVSFDTLSWKYEEVNELLEYCSDYLSKRGMYIEKFNFNGYKSLVATTQKTKTPKLLLQSHVDVVPGSDGNLKMKDKNGVLVGRGVYDMKFATAIFLKLLDEINIQDFDFGIMLTSDEEIGGENGVKALLENGFGAEVCVLPDAGDNWCIETSHKGSWIIKVTSTGISSHASRPWEGSSAISNLINALKDIDKLFKKAASDKDTVNINKIIGGSDSNQVADWAEALVNIRFISKEAFKTIENKVAEIIKEHDLSYETLRKVDINFTDVSNKYVKDFIEIAEKHSEQKINGIRSLGTSDLRYFAKHRIPTIMIRPVGGGAHSDEEWINKKSFEDYYQVVAEYVKKVAKI